MLHTSILPAAVSFCSKAGTSRLKTAYGCFLFFSKTGDLSVKTAYVGFNFFKAGASILNTAYGDLNRF